MATKSIAWNTGSGNITLTYQGQGDGTIAVSSDANDIGSARSQVVTVQTIGGAVTRNLTVSQAACPFPVNTTKSYSYTGSYQEVELPAGQYKFQCWGAQGGSNAAASSYSITAKAGGNGGYSEGIITLAQKTTVRVYVGGQGSSSSGGYNGGGSTTGSSSYSASSEYGTSRMGGGGGATDIRLSDGALLSRMIVAGGGSGGAMCYRSKTTTTTSWESKISVSLTRQYQSGNNRTIAISGMFDATPYSGKTVKFTITSSGSLPSGYTGEINEYNGTTYVGYKAFSNNTSFTFPSGFNKFNFFFKWSGEVTLPSSLTGTLYEQVSSSSTTTSTDYQVGGVGGGTQGGGYSTTYVGKQNAAGSNGSFGQGANQTATNMRYASGAGGGGWYGGGGNMSSDSSMTYCKYSGGGSGWVNIAANSGNRPSGYSGLELDSGTTYAGDTSFPNTAGTGNETGHSGNGYAKITRLA